MERRTRQCRQCSAPPSPFVGQVVGLLELVSTCFIDTVIVIFDVLIVTRHGLVTLIDQEHRPNLVVSLNE